jgi:hypothetical protein
MSRARISPLFPEKLIPGSQVSSACFRHIANLPRELHEIAIVHPNDATEQVIWKDRHCPRWGKYEPGVAPREQLQEDKSRAFEEERRAFERKLAEFEARQVTRERCADRRLTKAAIWLASIIGLAQIIASLLTMAKDSVAYPWFHAGYYSLRSLFP